MAGIQIQNWDSKLDERESNSFVALYRSYFDKSTLKSPRRKTVLCSFANFSNSGLRY